MAVASPLCALPREETAAARIFRTSGLGAALIEEKARRRRGARSCVAALTLCLGLPQEAMLRDTLMLRDLLKHNQPYMVRASGGLMSGEVACAVLTLLFRAWRRVPLLGTRHARGG